MCGENSNAVTDARRGQGSSPRVRGKSRPREADPVEVGLIPACAGKIRDVCRRLYPARAHPRVCGENTPSEVIGRWTGGSSPRVRGKSIPPHWSASCHRLIPACAGKTRGGRVRLLRASAHPRVCGENSGTARGSSPGRGSSPRVRGKPERRPGGDGGGGLIPACAGKTSTSSRAPRRRSAHPRVCGENAVHSLIGPAHPGSSPRVRGKQHRGRPILTRRGLIPACAGKTPRTSAPKCPHRAHPRVCGENLASIPS